MSSGKARGYAFDVDAWIQFHLLRLASFHPDTTKADIAVLAEIIQRYHGKFGNGWASHEHLGSMAGIHKASVIRAKRNLERLGFITVVQAGRRGSATVYQPNFALVPEKGSTDATETKGSMLATETIELGSTDATTTPEYGSTDATPSYLPDRPTRAESQIDRTECAAPGAPPLAGLAATTAGTAQGGFEELWKSYDYKQRKADARAAYDKLAPDPERHHAIVAAARAWQAAWAAQEKPDAPRFTLAKWIEREEWECDPPTAFRAKDRESKPVTERRAPKEKSVLATMDIEDDDIDAIEEAPIVLINDVGLVSPVGTFEATITANAVTRVGQGRWQSEKVELTIIVDAITHITDVTHTFFTQCCEKAKQDRGQAHLASLLAAVGIDTVDNLAELHGKKVRCTIDRTYAISYEPLAVESEPALAA